MMICRIRWWQCLFFFWILIGGCGGAAAPSGPAEIPGPVSVDGLYPPDGATDFSPSASLTIPFTEPMNTASVEAAFSLSPEAEAAALVKWQSVSGTFSWNGTDTEMTYDPTAVLEPLTRYCMRIGAGALTAAGEEIPTFESCFTTGAISCPSAEDPTAYESVFGSDTCTYTLANPPEGSPSAGDTISYDLLTFHAAEVGWNDELGCIFEAACLAGDTQCVTMETLMSVAEGCGINMYTGPLFQLNQESCVGYGPPDICANLPSEGEAFTVDTGSSLMVFALYVDYTESTTDVPGLSYGVYAMETYRTCNGDCWGGPSMSSCNDKSVCYVEITGPDIISFLTARGKLDAFNSGQCIDSWWGWDADTPVGQVASNLLHVRLQKIAGICP